MGWAAEGKGAAGLEAGTVKEVVWEAEETDRAMEEGTEATVAAMVAGAGVAAGAKESTCEGALFRNARGTRRSLLH